MFAHRARPIVGAAAVAVGLGLVAGCGIRWSEPRDPWRAEAEARCLAEGAVVPSEGLVAVAEIEGAGSCGMTKPFKVSVLVQGSVGLKPEATLACPVISQVQSWVGEAIQPAAVRWFGQPVVEIRQMSSYSCRSMNGQSGAPISEHAFGNALDVASFILADGRVISVKDHWKRGTEEERGFLYEVQAAACERFSTVLGPGADAFHYDHLHMDLARRRSGRVVCKPAPIPAGPAPGDLIAERSGRRGPGLGVDPVVTGSIRKSRPAFAADRTPIDMALPGGRLPRAEPGAD